MLESDSVIICAESYPKKIEKGQMIQLSCRLFDKKSLKLKQVSDIYMTITSLNDGYVAWPLGVIRKNASGFDIAIGTQEMKEGHCYLVRISNNHELSPSASTTFVIKKEKEDFEFDGVSIRFNKYNLRKTCKLQFTYTLN